MSGPGESTLPAAAPKGDSHGGPTYLGTPRQGTRLGRYEIRDLLGHGAMAAVFRARDSQLGREVAIKVMGMAVASRDGSSERFRREAHAVAALKHNGIVEIFDFVEATDETPSYIVAELIEGPTLRKFLDERRARLLPEEAALIALPLAEALAVAHERGIVHRDVKPDNVMIEKSGSSARVVITDFGVAHIRGLETMTASGALVGSPAYMSPEQARAHDVGPAADIWAVGALLYEMATGCLPFPGKDPLSVITAIARGSFRRPSQIVAAVGPSFESIILRCLRPNPAERYETAATLATDLRQLVQAAGLQPDATVLRRLLDDSAGFEAALRPKVADQAVNLARRHVRRGELAKALAELGRATAYVPSHSGAEALLRRISAGRSALRILIAVGALLTVAGATWGGWRCLARRTAKRPVVVAVAQPVPTLVKESDPTPAVPTAPLASHPTPQPSTEPAPEAPRPRRGAKPVHSAGKSSAVVETRPPAPAPTTEPAAPAAPEKPEPAAPAPAPTPKSGSVQLFATGAICYPSLDDHPPRAFMPRYGDVPPGVHRVYCARNIDGTKELVGEIELLPGARVERTVTQKDGKLTLASPR